MPTRNWKLLPRPQREQQFQWTARWSTRWRAPTLRVTSKMDTDWLPSILNTELQTGDMFSELQRRQEEDNWDRSTFQWTGSQRFSAAVSVFSAEKGVNIVDQEQPGGPRSHHRPKTLWSPAGPESSQQGTATGEEARPGQIVILLSLDPTVSGDWEEDQPQGWQENWPQYRLKSRPLPWRVRH